MSFSPTRRICEGSRLAVIAPAGPFNHEAFDKGVRWLRNRYELAFDDAIYGKCAYFAGTDKDRLKGIADALADPDVDGILCARGGFGTTRLLPGISVESIRKANKTVVGFSDITALHAAWARAGIRSIHAPMVSALGNAPKEVRSNWIDAVENSGKASSFPLESLSPGNAEGRFFGGNLAVLGALVGTPFAPPLDGTVLFLEDVGERPYRIDRMLTSLSQAGWFDNLSGLVLGAFTEGKPGTDGVSIDNVLEDQFGSASFPVLRGMSAGHISENIALPFGSTASIHDGTLTFSY